MTKHSNGLRLGAALLALVLALSLLPTAALAAEYTLTATDNGNGTWSSPSATLKVGDTSILNGYTSSYADTHNWTTSNNNVPVVDLGNGKAKIQVNIGASGIIQIKDNYSGSGLAALHHVQYHDCRPGFRFPMVRHQRGRTGQ